MSCKGGNEVYVQIGRFSKFLNNVYSMGSLVIK
jgi:hypothetical protein